jgi:hypothetical protein
MYYPSLSFLVTMIAVVLVVGVVISELKFQKSHMQLFFLE